MEEEVYYYYLTTIALFVDPYRSQGQLKTALARYRTVSLLNNIHWIRWDAIGNHSGRDVRKQMIVHHPRPWRREASYS